MEHKLLQHDIEIRHAVSSSNKLPDFLKKSKLTYDDIINKVGYGFMQLKFIILVFCSLSIEGSILSLMSATIIPIRAFYKMSDLEVEIMTGIIFIGVGAGSFSLGFVTKYITRKKYIIFSLILINISQYAFVLSDNIKLMMILRVFIGYSIGVILPLSLNILVEYLPNHNRVFTLTSIWGFYPFGQAVNLIAVLIFMPNYELIGLRKVLVYCANYTLICSIIILAIVKDTPRDLILNNEEFKGIEIVNSIVETEFSYSLTNKQKYNIIRNIKKSEDKNNFKGEFLDIFNDKYFWPTVLQTISWYSANCCLYGTMLIISVFLTDMDILDSNDTIGGMILYAFITCPFNLLGGYLAETEFLKRKKTVAYGALVSCIFPGLIILNPSNSMIWFILFTSFFQIPVNVITAFGSEIYHSKVRDLAFGYLFSITRVGGISSSFLYLAIYYAYPFGVWYFTIILLLFVAIANLMMPIETYGQDLDS